MSLPARTPDGFLYAQVRQCTQRCDSALWWFGHLPGRDFLNSRVRDDVAVRFEVRDDGSDETAETFERCGRVSVDIGQ